MIRELFIRSQDHIRPRYVRVHFQPVLLLLVDQHEQYIFGKLDHLPPELNLSASLISLKKLRRFFTICHFCLKGLGPSS